MQHTKDTTPRWSIPRKLWGTRQCLAFDEAPEEVKAKFCELYPTSYNHEIAAWFGISIGGIRLIAKRLDLRKDLSCIARRRYKQEGCPLVNTACLMRANPELYSSRRKRISEGVRKAWRRAKIQAEYDLPRTVRLRVSPLTKKQRSYKKRMLLRHDYFSDPGHPFWVCYDSQTTRSPRMEAKVIDMGLKIVEGED